MIRFSLDGVKHEFDDDKMSNLEVRELKKVTGFGFQEFWQSFAEMDAEAVTGIVWLARRREGETDLRFTDVDFDFMELAGSFETDKAEETDGETDPTPPADDAEQTPST